MQATAKINTTRITQKGQITIPKYIREYLGVKIKNYIEFEIEKGKVFINPSVAIEDNFGKVKPRQRPEDFSKTRSHFEKEMAKK
ncbi:MAG: AbrB/MazE/SpoVT family DNA-binding domain-containing protein [bacterium]